MQRKPKPGPATAEFNDLVEAEMRRYPPVERQQAVLNVARRHPELHAEALAEYCKNPRVAATVACGSRKLYRSVGRPEAEAALRAESQRAEAAKKAAAASTREQATAPVTSAPAPANATTSTRPESPRPRTEAERQQRLEAALAERHARGLDGSLAVLDLLKSPDAHLWGRPIPA